MSILNELKLRVSRIQSAVSEIAQQLAEAQEALVRFEERDASERSPSRDADDASEADGSNGSDERNDRFYRSENGLTAAQKDDVTFLLNAGWRNSDIAELYQMNSTRALSAIKKKGMTKDAFQQCRSDMLSEFTSFSSRVQATQKLRALLGVDDDDDNNNSSNNSSSSSNNSDNKSAADDDEEVIVTTNSASLLTGMPPSGWSDADADSALPLTPPPRSSKTPPATKKRSSAPPPLSAVELKPAPTSASKLSKKRKMATSKAAASAPPPPPAALSTRPRRRSAPSAVLAATAAPKEFALLEEVAGSSGFGALFLPEATDFFKTSSDWKISFDGTYRWVADDQFYVQVKK
jgi:hypothetical protein